MSKPVKDLGWFSLLSMGIGGMVGGGIFAVTGLAIILTHGGATAAFAIAGLIALLTAYSYTRLTLRYPSTGGTVEFLNRAFGPGVLTGTISILMSLSYMILLAIYAYAFGSYGANIIHNDSLTRHLLATGILVVLGIINFIGPHLVIKTENAFNVFKMLLLSLFILAGLISTGHWHTLSTSHWVPALPLISGAMIIFLNYEGFELIANAANRAKHPKKDLPIAYLGGVILVIVFYLAIVAVVLSHLSLSAIRMDSDNSLALTGRAIWGIPGQWLVIIAALAATSSAINATLYGSGRLTYLIAKYGELPQLFEHDIRHQPIEGMILFVVIAIIIVNAIPLSTIAAAGSGGFLLVFASVNLAAFRLAGSIGGHRLISALGFGACLLAFAAMIYRIAAIAGNDWQVLIIFLFIIASGVLEIIYRGLTGRVIHMGHPEHKPASKNHNPTRDQA